MSAYRSVSVVILLFICLRAAFLVEASVAQPVLHKITPSDVQRSDFFGGEIAATSDWVFVTGRNAVYVFDWTGNTWVERAKLVTPESLAPGEGSGFGACISVSGSYEAEGAVYIFEWNGQSWSQSSKLRPLDAGGSFGWSVAIDDIRLLVGALSDENGHGSGSVYAYEWDGASWNRAAKLIPPGSRAEDWFGRVVALARDLAVVGAPGRDAGVLYVYRQNAGTWILEATLLPDPGEIFRHSASLAGSRILVGAVRDPLSDKRGSVYVYENVDSSWMRRAKLLPPENPGWEFGSAVASTEAGVIYAGDRSDDEVAPWNGAVHVFELSVEPIHQAPESIELDGNYPNPFRSVTWLRLNVSKPSSIQVTVYDLLGRHVYERQVRIRPGPAEEYIWLDMPGFPAGAYTYRVNATNSSGVMSKSGSFVVVD